MCTLAITRSACGGSRRCLVTKATAFSFQSVITSAETGPLKAVRITNEAAQRRFLIMAISPRELSVAAAYRGGGQPGNRALYPDYLLSLRLNKWAERQ